MHIALGYRWFATSLGFHLERALEQLGHTVSYVGLPSETRSGYESGIRIDRVIAALPQLPDLYLWIDPAGRYFPAGIENLPIPSACWLVDVHLGHWRQEAARFFDAVFVAQKDYVPRFKEAVGHDQVYWLPLGAADDVHRNLHLPRIYDVGFVGNIARAHRGTARAQRLTLIASRFHTNDIYGAYLPAEVGRIYSQSRIVFNTSIAGDVTMRIFEGTACGAMVLTDAVSNGLQELFMINEELVTFQDDHDLVAKIEYYLEHADERYAIALAGERRTVTQHLYTHRTQTMLSAMTASQFKRIAPMRAASVETRFHARMQIYTHLHMLDSIMDEARSAGYGPLRRMWVVLPCLARRIWI
ncbi:MAG: glycosyltransferase [Chloroflexi bacterium]|nr:glycosyltransferase [Chloroflexota bacterium]MCL5274163.1 glycosyltransferase [Chloroflexota bacterium]